MNAQSNCISTISNNLSNSSTTAYKGGSTLFEELVSSEDTVSTSVSSSSHYYNDDQGTITSSDEDTNLAISGNGFFAVKKATVDSSGNTTFSDATYYTRSGDFSLNKDGYLVNSEGYYLLGWSVDPSTGTVNKSALSPVQISQVTNASVTTTTATYAANLPANADTSTTTSASSITMYDSSGTAHKMSCTWTKEDTSTWKLTVTAADSSYDADTAATTDLTANFTVTFDDNGNIDTISDNGSGSDIDETAKTVGLHLSYEDATDQTVSLDLSGITQQDATSYQLTSFSQNGAAAGTFSGIAMDESGNISVEYDNDVSLTYYQIPVATFSASDSLDRLSGTAYAQSYTSGSATYSTAGTNGAGALKTSSLESSNVDIATEFTKLVAAQQAYSANSKTITTVDNMLQSLVDMSA